MTTRWIFASIVFAALGIASTGPAAEPPKKIKLPDPPKGFTWVELSEIDSTFLRPEGWHLRKERARDVFAFFITREEVPPEGQFQTGLTVNVIVGRKNFDAVKYAKEFVSEFRRKGNGPEPEEVKRGNLVGYSTTVKMNDAQGEFPMYVAAIGNTKTQTVYVLFFESSPEDWDEAWKIGEVIARKFVLPQE